MHSLRIRRPTRWRLACRLLLQLLVCAPVCLPQVVGASLAPPTGPVVLVIAGNISKTNVGNELHLDMDALHALPAISFDTQTPWTAERWLAFRGVSLKALLQYAGAGSDRFSAHGLDDYTAEFQDIDLDRYPVMIAYLEDGKPLSLRQLGPLRIVFPISDFPELDTESNTVMAVWQLVRMTVL